jgi:aerobic-type carbon monoxide dehydrogenase small subunit (CoxS/CutS family)
MVEDGGQNPGTEDLEILFTLNGKSTQVCVPAAERLLDTLRYRLDLPGTKEGCGEGECGACTVHLDGLPVNSCLLPTYQIRGHQIDTIESVPGADLTALHRAGTTQCGACTPGVVMTARWLTSNPALRASHGVRELMAGNLCRCTGYDGIIEGVEQQLTELDSGKGKS